MKKTSYVAGAVVLALVGLGIYNSQAQNMDANNEGGAIIIEEQDYVVMPNKANNMPQKPAATTDGVTTPDFQPLPEDPGVEVAPDNMPADGMLKKHSPDDAIGVVIEEDVMEVAD